MPRKNELQFEDFVSDIASGKDLSYLEKPLSRRSFVLVAIISVIIILVIFFRLIFLNVVKGEFYQARALANVNRVKVLPAHRGVITDISGEVLARNADTFSVYLDVKEAALEKEELPILFNKLKDVLEVDLETLEKIVEETNFETSHQVALARNITSTQAIELKRISTHLITVEPDFRREYIDGEVFSSVIGYTGLSTKSNIVEGKAGLEAYYDKEIRGEDGEYVYYRDVFGDVFEERVVKDPVPGDVLTTTIDADLQRYFHQRLQSQLNSLGSRAGVGIAINPKSGDILALINFPTYDNNVFVTSGMNQERVELLSDKNLPLFNRSVSGAYSPGSTIKPLVAMAALKEGVVDDLKSIYSAGYIEIANPYFPEFPSRFLDWKAHGWVNAYSALARSSNVYFYAVGGGFEDVVGLGIERLKKYWSFFGFGTKTGVDLPGEISGFLPDPEEKEERTGEPWRIGDTYNVSIGQGDFLVTPIQLVNHIASIANNGVMYRPRVISEISSYDNERVKKRSVEVIKDYSSLASEIEVVQMGMRDAVMKDYGTAKLLSSLRYETAGKTGSAQISNNTKTNAFFVGYGPYEDPEIAIIILIEDAKEGSLNAVPVAYDVMNWYYENRVNE
ncbi:MAG: penicillin-binding protein 2 [Candidatus Harrisonbacteria bacterium CG10_big_fil_rev_8_21_14_0_10_38_8]|uniref:Penicillin-binding protein 2 n=1 Tax=Candidatus Harrisonbacteria bacterium CG10_big_fil_rev_8_21_14_0_10_38_8 TaxID=1974582 RepID=A0A2M6WK55_9BACT|nr:MAG: penicillin-binding protein 2 [Candidatus Harrisonbacteria bacterium CG10_big_fil_rev_8_21_14_0_10_38_8]